VNKKIKIEVPEILPPEFLNFCPLFPSTGNTLRIRNLISNSWVAELPAKSKNKKGERVLETFEMFE